MAVQIRSEETTTKDIRIDRPATAPAKVKYVGDGLATNRFSIAGEVGYGACKIYGGEGSGGAYVSSAIVTSDSGTPYPVTTITIIG